MGAPVQIGDILASKYRVERVLGMGGMGMVVAARHMHLGSLVALKFMIPTKFDMRDAAGRFVREARAAARLRSEHIARVSDYGVLDTGAPYIVMEFLEGADLHAVLKERGRLPIDEALGYLIDVCKAMAEAHAAGIVHRDLKPQNLLLTHRFDGTPLIKVLDFGISKFTNEVDCQDMLSTTTGSLLGSPGFMAPEQMCNSKDVDARADIYAVGGIAFRLVTGELPFHEDSFAEMVAAVLYKHPRRARALRPDVPLELEVLIACCLQKDPNGRYSSMEELMTALQSIADRLRAEKSGDLTATTDGGDGAAVPVAKEGRPIKPLVTGSVGGLAIAAVLGMLTVSDFVLHERAQRLRDPFEQGPPAGALQRAMPARVAGIESSRTESAGHTESAGTESAIRDIDAGAVENMAPSATPPAPVRRKRTLPRRPPDDRPPDLDLIK